MKLENKYFDLDYLRLNDETRIYVFRKQLITGVECSSNFKTNYRFMIDCQLF